MYSRVRGDLSVLGGHLPRAKPASGPGAFELGHIEARNRHIEFEMWREIGISWVHGPIVAQLGIVKQIPEAKAASDVAARNYYERLDREFAQRALMLQVIGLPLPISLCIPPLSSLAPW